MRKLSIAIVGILAMTVLIGFPYYGYGDVIYGCYQKNNGQLRIVENTTECRKSEIPISWAGLSEPATILVDCDNGETITDALQQLGNPLTIQVKGTCYENVQIIRDDVTLIADPSGGAINGADSNTHTIDVRAGRTVIDGLTVTGGLNGIYVYGSGGLTIQDCTVQKTGRNGIVFNRGSYGAVDNCTVQSNKDHGIYIEGASATVTNSTISLNGMGIDVGLGGSARIGLTDRFEYAGNTISTNQGNGIQITHGGSAYIGGNTVNGNCTNPTSPHGRFGVSFIDSNGVLVGNNKITGNGGTGLYIQSSNVYVGNPDMPLPTTGDYANVISGNTNGGITGNLGASLWIRNTIINGNAGNGVSLGERSIMRMSGNTINNNTGNGILLMSGGGLLLPDPAVTVTENALFGLQCFGDESSYMGNISGILGNTGGDVSTNCTGF